MGNIIDFSKYLCEEDCFTLDQMVMSSSIVNATKKLNQQLLTIAKASEYQNAKDIFYPLVYDLHKFINYYSADLSNCLQLKFEILNVLNKIRIQNQAAENLSSDALSMISDTLINNFVFSPTKQVLHDLMTYETYAYLGVIKELEVHHKLMTERVRELNVYSLLISDYQPPKIETELLEQYFQDNRKRLMHQLISPENKIKHVHYDYEFLKYFCNVQKIFSLSGRDSDQYLNQKIKIDLLETY